MEKTYKPTIIMDGKYVTMAVSAKKCPICDKVMIERIEAGRCNGVFDPYGRNMCQEAQAAAAGIVFVGRTTDSEEHRICEECEKAGKAEFLCAICNEKKPVNKMHTQIGYLSSEYLCEDCYETVPAKTWDDKVSELEENHQYDYE